MQKADNTNGFTNRRMMVPPEFSGVFSHFYVARNDSGKTIRKTLLPSYQTIFVFNFGAGALLHTAQDTTIGMDKCVVLGPIRKAIGYALPPQSEILVLNLIDDAFYRFFGQPPIPANVPIHPDSLLDDNCFTGLWSILNGMDNADQRVDCLLGFCRPYLSQRSPLAEALVNFDTSYQNPIKAIADRERQSERNIQLNHKRQFGYSVKELNRYRRFVKAIALIRQMATGDEKPDWFGVIHACGYYDQSQLIHDFKHYLNLSPTKYLKFQRDICNPAG